jgi:peroxiredoxin
MPNAPAPSAPPPNRSLAVASIALGLLALVLSPLRVGAIPGLAGLIAGGVYLTRAPAGRRLGWIGTWLSIFGLVASGILALNHVASFADLRTLWADASEPEFSPTAWEGVAAPDFSVTTLDGQTVRLSALRGKRVVVDIWATWCGPCVAEIPHFTQIQKETAPDQLTIVGVSSETKDALQQFVKKTPISYAIASADELPAPYGTVAYLPTTFFIDRQGIIQTVSVGSLDLATLREKALAADYAGAVRPAPRTHQKPAP